MGRNTLGSSDTGELKGGWTGEIEIIEKDRHDIRGDKGCIQLIGYLVRSAKKKKKIGFDL